MWNSLVWVEAPREVGVHLGVAQLLAVDEEKQ